MGVHLLAPNGHLGWSDAGAGQGRQGHNPVAKRNQVGNTNPWQVHIAGTLCWSRGRQRLQQQRQAEEKLFALSIMEGA